MQVHIGSKIRELRKERNISQEVLAQFLGVSFQAVSKWEVGTAMPDIMLIPAIASFFGVSTDELFDYDRMQIEKKVEEIVTEAAELRCSDPRKAEKILRKGLKQFPGNEILLNNLLYTMRSPERSEEVIDLCKALSESAKEDDVRYDALRILAETYHECSQQSLVEPTLEKIPEVYFTKLELMAELMTAEKSLQAARQQMWLSFETLVEMLNIMQVRYMQHEDQNLAMRCEAAANQIMAIFQKELPSVYEESGVENNIQEVLKNLS